MIVVCLLKSMCIPSFVLIGCCMSKLHGHLCPYRNVLPEAVYCCFTRTTLFTTMFTVIIVVFLLKRICMPSFVLIGCCVSELHGHLCPYRNVLPEAVYCCFTRTTLFILQTCNFPIPWSLWISISTHVCMIRGRGFYHVTKFRYSKPSGF